jgi:hypothetical protein
MQSGLVRKAQNVMKRDISCELNLTFMTYQTRIYEDWRENSRNNRSPSADWMLQEPDTLHILCIWIADIPVNEPSNIIPRRGNATLTPPNRHSNAYGAGSERIEHIHAVLEIELWRWTSSSLHNQTGSTQSTNFNQIKPGQNFGHIPPNQAIIHHNQTKQSVIINKIKQLVITITIII